MRNGNIIHCKIKSGDQYLTELYYEVEGLRILICLNSGGIGLAKSSLHK